VWLSEQKTFLTFAKDYRLYSAFVVNLDTGLRLGELLALTWKDIDLVNGFINVNKNIVVVEDRDNETDNKTKLLVQDTTKTKSGKRKIPLIARSLQLLNELKLKQQANSDIVFCSEKGTHVFPRNFERTFSKVINKAGIDKCNVHTMRHTFATRLFEKDVSVKTVSKLLGHSSVSFTLNFYIHVLPTTKAEAIKVLDTLYDEM